MSWTDEVEKRRLAGAREPFAFVEAERSGVRVRSGSGNTWLVLPDLMGLPSTCDCPDFRTAGLGICKHVEAVRLYRTGKKASVEPPARNVALPAGLSWEPRGGEVLVLDLETQRAFDEVPDRQPGSLGLSLGVVWSYDDAAFTSYWEKDATALIERLRAADLVVGFNHKRFDLEVLRSYGPVDDVRCFDLLEDLHGRLGHRVSLDGCCAATLGTKKSGHGLQAIVWYREGRNDLLERYCQDDVRLTRALFDHGRLHGGISVEKRDARGYRQIVPVKVEWNHAQLPAPLPGEQVA